MSVDREENVERLSDCQAGVEDPSYLHLRSLFADLKHASSYARGRLLDIGCGNKPYAGMFASRVSEHVGCDVVQSSKRRVDIICPATALAVGDSSYDTVLATQVIEHVADHRAMLREAFRALKDNGVLILSGPMYWPLHEEPHDYFRFTEHGLRYLVESVGFAVVEIKQNGGKWALCGQVIVHTISNTRLLRRCILKAINRIFAFLDDRFPSRENPMNYVLVAYKPSGITQ
jgi:SAM-dependent methyltransferase